MAEIITLGGAQPVDDSEALVVSHIARELPHAYLLYPNLEIRERHGQYGQHYGQPYEYDLIVVAPHAVYVVEIKRWLGRITGGDHSWELSSGVIKPNPLRLANHKARVLKGHLIRHSLGLKQEVWIEACVAIADAKTVLNLTGAAGERTFRYQDLPAFLQDPSRLHPPYGVIVPNGIVGHVKPIRDAVEQEESVRARGKVPRRVGHYEVVEMIDSTSLVTDYLARNVYLGDMPTRLRIYDFSQYSSAEQRDDRINRIKRDALALQSIGAHPNLVQIRDFFTDEGGRFVEVTEWSGYGTLRDVIERDQPLTSDEKLDLIQGIARGLAIAHARGIIHRDLRPVNVLIAADLTPRLMNFERSRLEITGQATVWQPVATDAERRYLPPELDRLDYTATTASDLYALGAIIYELYSGTVPYPDPAALLRAGGIPPALTDSTPSVMPEMSLLAGTLYRADVATRGPDAAEVVTVIDRMRTASNTSEAEEQRTHAALPMSNDLFYKVGDTINGEYQVLAQLGEGGFGHVYKVLHYITDHVYALKVLNGDFKLESLQQEYHILAAVSHPNIARVSWAGMIRPDQFYLVLEYIEGQPLNRFITPGNLLQPAETLRLIARLLSVLEYIHRPNRERVAELLQKNQDGEDLTAEEYQELQQAKRRFLHRDIKPHNLMLTGDGDLKLIDFNIAARLDEGVHYSMVGTAPYMAPDIQIQGWDESVDLFAVGVVLYEMMTGHHPFVNGTPTLDGSVTNPSTYRSDLSDECVTLLMKAVQPARDARFQTAHEMHAELLNLEDRLLRPGPGDQESSDEQKQHPDVAPTELTLEDWEIGRPNYNPYVTRLLTLYSQARRNNSGTRGLDEIARATYVPTRLDERLMPDIMDGKHRLVIITGNAGDGKTAFIQQLEAQAEFRTGVHVERHGATAAPIGSHFHLSGFDFVTNYDGSQDDGELINDRVLQDFFAPFQGNDPWMRSGTIARLIAINEGRLRDFLHEHQGEYPSLYSAVLQFFDGGETPQGLLIVNLNLRAVAAGGSDSIFSRQLKVIAQPHFWAPCQSCDYRDVCFLRGNAARIADVTDGDRIVDRLRTLFEVVYLRRRMHITMRDTRSALSYIMLRDQSCNDVARMVEEGGASDLSYLQYAYYNAIASPHEPAGAMEQSLTSKPTQPDPPDRLMRLLVEIDPALVSNPDDDWRLHFMDYDALAASSLLGFSTLGFDAPLLHQIHDDVRAQRNMALGPTNDETLARSLSLHAMLRRKSYFERRDAGWSHMLPYAYLDDFQQLVASKDGASDQDKLRSDIAYAISRAEGMRDDSRARVNVALRAQTTAKATVKSFRLFPTDEFRLKTRSLGPLESYIEYIPDHVFFEHARQPARLSVSLDLFELLRRIAAGNVSPPADVQGYFLNLAIFKNALSHLPYREVLLTDDDQQFYRIWSDDEGTIHMAIATAAEAEVH